MKKKLTIYLIFMEHNAVEVNTNPWRLDELGSRLKQAQQTLLPHLTVFILQTIYFNKNYEKTKLYREKGLFKLPWYNRNYLSKKP